VVAAGKRRSCTTRAGWKTTIEEGAFSCSVKKEKVGCPVARERSGPRGDCNPFLFQFFPKTKKKKNREKRSMRGGESFANKFQQYFEILIFGTKQLLKYCKYFGLLTSIEIRKGEEGFIKPSTLIAKTK
jgi:hypothetical protein